MFKPAKTKKPLSFLKGFVKVARPDSYRDTLPPIWTENSTYTKA